MTARWRAPTPEPPFNAWVRGHPELDSKRHHVVVTDTDMWVHRFGRKWKGVTYRDVQCIMFVEIKTHGADLNDGQRDTLHFANQLLRTEKWTTQRVNGRYAPGHQPNTARVRAWSHLSKQWVEMRSYGAHKLRLAGTDPLDSSWISWDDKPITIADLLKLLRFDLHPDSLNPVEWRRHKRIKRDATLFEPVQFEETWSDMYDVYDGPEYETYPGAD